MVNNNDNNNYSNNSNNNIFFANLKVETQKLPLFSCKCKIFRILLKYLSDHLPMLFQFA